METRVAVLSIIVENMEVVEQLNTVLHENGAYIIGRMGLPYRERGSASSASRWTRPRM